MFLVRKAVVRLTNLPRRFLPQVAVAIVKFFRAWMIKVGIEITPHAPALQKLFVADVIPGDASDVLKKEVRIYTRGSAH